MKNKRVVLLPGNFGVRATRILLAISGMVFLLNGVVQLIIRPEAWWGWALAIAFMAMAAANLVGAFWIFAPGSKYAPRVEINPERVLVKNDVLKPARTVTWSSVELVRFGSFEICFKLKDNTEAQFPINTDNPDISKEVKAEIRYQADDQKITVEGG